jgi:lipopolysaccharide biosynthesis glycosyltransferase
MRAVVRSCITNTKSLVSFFIFTRGIDKATFDRTVSSYPKEATYSQIEMDDYHFAQVKLAKWVTLSTMDRLSMPSILKGISRIVYLDIDLVVLGDIEQLFYHPVGECGLAAKQSTRSGYLTNIDYATRTQIDFNKVERLCGSYPNFNAGVLVMDLDVLRKQGMEQFTKTLVEETYCNDQIALSSYSRGRFERLPARWNTWVGVDHNQIQDPAILHYVGKRKPWWRKIVPLRQIWNSYYASS